MGWLSRSFAMKVWDYKVKDAWEPVHVSLQAGRLPYPAQPYCLVAFLEPLCSTSHALQGLCKKLESPPGITNIWSNQYWTVYLDMEEIKMCHHWDKSWPQCLPLLPWCWKGERVISCFGVSICPQRRDVASPHVTCHFSWFSPECTLTLWTSGWHSMELEAVATSGQCTQALLPACCENNRYRAELT